MSVVPGLIKDVGGAMSPWKSAGIGLAGVGAGATVGGFHSASNDGSFFGGAAVGTAGGVAALTGLAGMAGMVRGRGSIHKWMMDSDFGPRYRQLTDKVSTFDQGLESNKPYQFMKGGLGNVVKGFESDHYRRAAYFAGAGLTSAWMAGRGRRDLNQGNFNSGRGNRI